MRIELRRLWLSPLMVLISVVAIQAQPTKKLALVGGMLLDGYEVPPVHHAAILVEDNKIVEVGRAAEMTIPPDATVIDTSGRVMMPGLIELHAHLMLLGHGNYARWFPWQAEQGLGERTMEISAKQLLMAGITSAADIGGPLKESLSVRDRINKGEIPGPRMWMSGPWISTRPWRLGGLSMTWPGIETPEDAARATEELVRAGVDLIKGQSGLSFEYYKAMVEVAHKHGLKVHAHVNMPQEARDAVDAGCDVLTHVGYDRPAYDPELVKDIVVKGIPVNVTAAFRAWVFPATVDFPERLQDPQLKKDFGPKIYQEVQDSFKSFHTLSYFRTTSEREMLFREASVKQWIDSGAVIGMGTDSGTPMNFHTEALWREMKAFVDLGMSPQRAISAATRINARILGRGSDLGTIEAGKLADIIVVKGNPLFNIMALADVEVVVKDGVVYKGGPGGRGRVTESEP